MNLAYLPFDKKGYFHPLFITFFTLKSAIIVAMKACYFKTLQLLSTNAVGGAGLLVCLFLFCFLIVHILVLTKLGWETQRKNDRENEPAKREEKKAPEPKPSPEPIYYIVERKRNKSRSKYSEPKEIRFK